MLKQTDSCIQQLHCAGERTQDQHGARGRKARQQAIAFLVAWWAQRCCPCREKKRSGHFPANYSFARNFEADRLKYAERLSPSLFH